MSPDPLDRFESYHAWLRDLPGYRGQIASFRFFPPRAGAFADGVPEPYVASAGRLGLRAWRHQAEGLQHVADGRDLVVATPTASGKSWIYRLPVLDALARGRTALLLFPTKALAHDQLASLRQHAATLGLEGVESYDGDTPRALRPDVRAQASALISNPDMLHAAILPFHPGWARFLARLEVVVVDELHAYRGVLGSHVGNVLRRLLRLAERYGARPRVVAASATIANPGDLLEDLTGRAPEVVRDDTAPRGPREFLFWEPPTLDRGDGRRRSATIEAAELAVSFLRAGLQSLFFCNSRKGAELLRRYAAAHLEDDEKPRLESYRAGYTLEERRRIEGAFRRGEITVLTATSALELGMDVGGVDAVVMVGYPGSLMSLWQRAGRAGRGGGRSLAVLIPGNDPLDEHYLHHPDQLTEGRVETAVADPFNSEIHPWHVACAAAEAHVALGESCLAPWLDLAEVPGLVPVGERFASRVRYPHRRVSLRGLSGGRVRLRSVDGRSLGVSSRDRAVRELHPGAVHLHQGEPYLVLALDLEEGRADLVPHIEDWYTQVREETRIEILEPIRLPAPGAAAAREGLAPPAGVHVGRVRVIEEVHGYVRKRYRSEAVLEERPLDLPPRSYETQALWFSAASVRHAVAPADLASALHALEHAMIGLLPAFVLCERADVGGVSYPRYPDTDEPTVFVYDGAPGGVGYARAGALAFPDWLRATRDLLHACPCRGGCPRCVLSPKCGNGNQYLDKAAAAALAEALGKRLQEGEKPARERVLH